MFLSVYIVNRNRSLENRSRAASLQSANTTPSKKYAKTKYKPGEVIIKFRPGIIDETVIPPQNFKQALAVNQFPDTKQLPSVKKLFEKLRISKIEKIFKDAKKPADDINEFRQQFPQRSQLLNQEEALQIDLTNYFKVEFDSSISVESIINNILQNPFIVYAEPNFIYSTEQTYPNDPYYLDRTANKIYRDPAWNPDHDYQWNLRKISMENAWKVTQGDGKVITAVIDTGVDDKHPELASNVILGHDYVGNDNNPMDNFGHGTHVAGIIAALTNNNLGIASVCPKCKILAIKALDDRGSGFVSNLGSAIYEATAKGARVINASWGGAGESQTLSDAINYAYLRGVIFVAAAGNSNDDVAGYSPANITCTTTLRPEADCTISVSSTDESDRKSSFSNYGSGIDVSAPGGSNANVLSLKSSIISPNFNQNVVGKQYLRLAGTSMSAPHVAALAGLVISLKPTFTPDQIRNVILNGSDDLGTPSFDTSYGYGRINAGKTLTTLNSNPPPVAKITAPPKEFITGPIFKLYGSAYAQNFTKYKIEYAASPTSTTWQTAGITLVNSGNSPVYNNELASVNFNTLASRSYYFKLTTTTQDMKTISIVYPIKVDRSVRNNFPIKFGSSTLDQKPVVADIYGDGKKEIIFKNSLEGKLYVVNTDGKPLPGWPQSTQELFSSYSTSYSPVVVNLDTSYPGSEIVLPVIAGNITTGVQLLAFHADGTVVSGWTVSDWNNKGNLAFLPYFETISAGLTYNPLTALYPTGGTSTPFIAYAESFKHNYSSPLYLHLFKPDAQELPGWPIAFQNESDLYLTPKIADLNADGVPEIIINYSINAIRIYAINGRLKKEVRINPTEEISQIAIADLDNDAFFEIIAISNGFDSLSHPINKIYVWDYQGTIKLGWPYTIKSTTGYYFVNYNTTLSIGDLNNDKYADIITKYDDGIAGKYYALNRFGTLLPGFPNSGPIIFNLLDGITNITISNNNHLLASGEEYGKVFLKEYNPSLGNLINASGFPKNFGADTYDYFSAIGTLALDDLDKNGLTELIVPVIYGGMPDYNKAYLYVFNLPYTTKFLDWQQSYHDAQHTGTYRK